MTQPLDNLLHSSNEMKSVFSPMLLSFAAAGGALGYNNGVALTPPMGWNCKYHINNLHLAFQPPDRVNRAGEAVVAFDRRGGSQRRMEGRGSVALKEQLCCSSEPRATLPPHPWPPSPPTHFLRTFNVQLGTTSTAVCLPRCW
jgi:hypothetical protein